MVYRIYVEKKPALANEARSLLSDCRNLLGIDALQDVRLLNRYDAENISRDLFDYAVQTVFSEPQLDIASENPKLDGDCVRRGISSRPVRPAGGFCRPVHPDHFRGSGPRSAPPRSTCCTADCRRRTWTG